MTGKANFSEEEGEQILEGPPGAGMRLVLTGDGSPDRP